MDHWEYQMLVAGTVGGIGNMWGTRGPDGLTDWDRLQNMGRDGWELVSTVPIIGQFGMVPMSVTIQVVFTFKRKAQAQMQAAPQIGAPQP
ncbi:MAG TPA: hypothetical protein VLQ48_15120 [Chloroflexia bacterium]|jgi:hypothetical protein|nr:hypothetical protein [Chloroflexia bacterium]